MKKLLIVTIIVLVLSLSFSFAASKFTDVNGTKYEVAVTTLNSQGIIDGFTDGTFRPQSNVTRAQLCKLLVEALGLKPANNILLTQFNDVNSTMWFYDYVKIAVDNGIIIGYQDGTFRPNNDVNYNELYTMIIRAMGKESVMTDRTWPSAYIAYASYYGLTQNVYYTDGTLPAIRGEVSISLYNMLVRMAEEADKKDITTIMYGFVESTSTKNKVQYAKIEGVTYPVSSRSSSFITDTFVVFEKSSLTGEIILGEYYSVKDLDAKADIVTYVTGSQGAQQVKVKGSSSYINYFTNSNIIKYSSYGICVINVSPDKDGLLEVTKFSTKSSIEDVRFSVGDRILEDSKTKVFLVFKGLSDDDVVTKGRVTPTVEYATITYAWDGQHPSAAVLPKREVVEIGEYYHIKYPELYGYEFYCTNMSTQSFRVRNDVTLYIATVDFGNYYIISYDWDGQHPSGARLPKSESIKEGELYHINYPEFEDYEFYCTNLKTESFIVRNDFTILIGTVDYEHGTGLLIPLVERCTHEELVEGLEYALEDYYWGADRVVVHSATFSRNGSDVNTAKFSATYSVYGDSDDIASIAGAGNGILDQANGLVRNKTGSGILANDGDEFYIQGTINTGK